MIFNQLTEAVMPDPHGFHGNTTPQSIIQEMILNRRILLIKIPPYTNLSSA